MRSPNAAVLFERERHEALDGTPWNEAEARRAIEGIVAGLAADFRADGLWAVHPLDHIAQSERTRRKFGRYHPSLWTGDVGLAVYLWSCVRGDAAFPTLDFF